MSPVVSTEACCEIADRQDTLYFSCLGTLVVPQDIVGFHHGVSFQTLTFVTFLELDFFV